MVNLLNNAPNQASKFNTKNWVEKNYESHGVYKLLIKLNFKLRCWDQDYVIIVTCTYILVKGNITVPNTGTAAAANKRNEKVIFKNYASFTDCIGEKYSKE